MRRLVKYYDELGKNRIKFMQKERPIIKITSKLGAKFLKGFNGKSSFISMARSVNASLNHYERNEPDMMKGYASNVGAIVDKASSYVTTYHQTIKNEMNQQELAINYKCKETATLNFGLERGIVSKIIRLGLLADELFAMLDDYKESFIADRTMLSNKYQKPVIEALKTCLDDLMVLETKSRKNRKGGLYEKKFD